MATAKRPARSQGSASESKKTPAKGTKATASKAKKNGKSATARAKTRDPKGAAKSKHFDQARTRAEGYLHDPKKAKKLATDAAKKVDKQSDSGPLKESIGYLKALIRLIGAYGKGDYRSVPWETLILAVAAVLYFVSPVDFIPDVFPVVGFSDDAVVVAFVVGLIKNDLDEFIAWEDQGPVSG